MATNIGVTSSYDPDEYPILSENLIPYVIAGGSGFLFIILCLCTCVIYMVRKPILEKKRPFKPGGFDVHRCEYCECRSNTNIPLNESHVFLTLFE